MLFEWVTVRFSSARQISDTYSFHWIYQKVSSEERKCKAAMLAEKYSNDISSDDIAHEMNHISMVSNANFGIKQLGALEKLNALAEYRLKSTFSNLSVSLRMLLTAPVTVASSSLSSSQIISAPPWIRIV